MAFGAPSIKGRALRYLAQREHSRAELARKLARHVEDLPEASARVQIDAALDELAAHGLLSDERTAQAVLNHRGARHGERRLRQDLQAKGLAPELVAQTLQQARGSEFERALQVWQRKFGRPPQDASEAGKQMRFMAGRGFSGEIVRRVMRARDEDVAALDAGDSADAEHGDHEQG
jgi:regulatory protein